MKLRIKLFITIFASLALLCLLTGPAFTEQPPQLRQEDSKFESHHKVETTQPQVSGQKWRWTVPYYRSVLGFNVNSGTAIQVVNLSGSTCDVTAEWFVQDTLVCSSSASLEPKNHTVFCSRDMSGIGEETESCDVNCDSALTADQGWIKISTSKIEACEKVILDVKVHYTKKGSDEIITTVNQKVIKKKLQRGD